MPAWPKGTARDYLPLLRHAHAHLSLLALQLRDGPLVLWFVQPNKPAYISVEGLPCCGEGRKSGSACRPFSICFTWGARHTHHRIIDRQQLLSILTTSWVQGCCRRVLVLRHHLSCQSVSLPLHSSPGECPQGRLAPKQRRLSCSQQRRQCAAAMRMVTSRGLSRTSPHT